MPGGFMHQVSDRALAELQKRAPVFPVEPFVREVGFFSIERTHRKQPCREVCDELEAVAASARSLYELLSARSEELDMYLFEECLRFGHPDLVKEIARPLLRLGGLSQNAAKVASSGIKRGREADPITLFVLKLAAILRKAGHVPNAAANGPLVIAFSIACDELSITVADPADTVRKKLKAAGGNKPA